VWFNVSTVNNDEVTASPLPTGGFASNVNGNYHNNRTIYPSFVHFTADSNFNLICSMPATKAAITLNFRQRGIPTRLIALQQAALGLTRCIWEFYLVRQGCRHPNQISLVRVLVTR
jgi:hypothetical protein